MTDTRLHPGSPERSDSIRAAEYVLHLLEPAERSSFEERLATSGGLRALVSEWSERLARLADEVREVVPPALIRKRLARFAGAEARGPSRARPGSLMGGLVRGLLGGLAVAAALVVLLMLALPWVEPPYSGPLYRAQIASDDAELVVFATYDPRQTSLAVQRDRGGAEDGRVLELWLIADGADAPESLGVLPAEPVTSVSLTPAQSEILPTGVLAISSEPPGGSPDGSPSEVLATGQVNAL